MYSATAGEQSRCYKKKSDRLILMLVAIVYFGDSGVVGGLERSRQGLAGVAKGRKARGVDAVVVVRPLWACFVSLNECVLSIVTGSVWGRSIGVRSGSWRRQCTLPLELEKNGVVLTRSIGRVPD